jgi:hypothetical protein
MATYQGSSCKALVELGRQKGYELVCTTTFNAFFIRRDFYPLFAIPDNSLDLMREPSMLTELFQ